MVYYRHEGHEIVRPVDGSGWGAGGPPGLQIRSGGGNVSGGFDSLTLPPVLSHWKLMGIEARSPPTNRKKSPRVLSCVRATSRPSNSERATAS